MKQITVRRVSEKCLQVAKQKALQRHQSMNAVLLEALETGLGVAAESTTNGLEKYSGDSDFGPNWEHFLKVELNKIDQELWQ